MEMISLMACMGCQRIEDQFTFPPRCPRCGTRFFKSVHPSTVILIKWFLAHPKHVTKLILNDIREKWHEATSINRNSDSTGS